jgi:hypothetical protein
MTTPVRPVPVLGLSETGSITLDGTGNGTARLRPDGPNEHWLPTVASVKCSSNTAEAACQIYIGQSATDVNFVDGTFSGSSGDSTDKVTGYDISRHTNAYIFAVWTGGDPGANAVLVLSGTKEIR